MGKCSPTVPSVFHLGEASEPVAGALEFQLGVLAGCDFPNASEARAEGGKGVRTDGAKMDTQSLIPRRLCCWPLPLAESIKVIMAALGVYLRRSGLVKFGSC